MKFICLMKCRYCSGACIKKGNRNGCQKLFCKNCGRHQQETYVRRFFHTLRQNVLEFLHCEGCSISTIGRFLKFSKTTICRWIKKIGSNYVHQAELKTSGEYQVDELRTYVGHKRNESWIMYAIEKLSGSITVFCVGRRTKENLEKIISVLLKNTPKKICTDRLQMYGSLVPGEVREVRKTRTNKIERKNLQLRTQLKRLNRKTICFSKSEDMLRASFRLLVKYMSGRNVDQDFVL